MGDLWVGGGKFFDSFFGLVWFGLVWFGMGVREGMSIILREKKKEEERIKTFC